MPVNRGLVNQGTYHSLLYPCIFTAKQETVKHLLLFYCFTVLWSLKYCFLTLYLMNDFNYQKMYKGQETENGPFLFDCL